MDKILLDKDDRDELRTLIRDRLDRYSHLLFTNEEEFLKQINALLKSRIAISQKQLNWLIKILEKTKNEEHHQAA